MKGGIMRIVMLYVIVIAMYICGYNYGKTKERKKTINKVNNVFNRFVQSERERNGEKGFDYYALGYYDGLEDIIIELFGENKKEGEYIGESKQDS